ncbi:MAG TPA: ABC transporter ATP-binding protein [Bryobacteraceae bacterium]|nr:ABC transporter ATP-binding protein [Bryobacteraceae bacterium]
MLQARNITKTYPTANGALPVLQDVSLSLNRGDALSIMGPSGSGKSTLLYILGALDMPTSGEVILEGENPFTMDEPKQAAFRNQRIGFLFQEHCLLPQCSVLENVLTPVLVAGRPDTATEQRAKRLLEQVGLSSRSHHRPGELSGGEKQRAALARALIRQPLLLLCDEPTGNLDRKSAESVADLLLALHQAQQTILVVVTHSAQLADRLPMKMEMHDQNLRAR